MTKVKMTKNIFYFELNSKPNVDILGITVFLSKQHNFETIFTSNDVMNIKFSIGKGFGSVQTYIAYVPLGLLDNYSFRRPNARLPCWLKRLPNLRF